LSVAAPLVFDPADEAVRRDPFAVFARLRDEDPVHWSPALKTWVVTRYDDVRDVAMTADLSPNRLAPFYASLRDERRSMLAEVMRYLSVWLVFRDPPEHTRLRRLLNGVVNPKLVAAMRPSIRRVVDEVLAYVAPALLGAGLPMFDLEPPEDLEKRRGLRFTGLERIGPDLRLMARF
jgi:cytochrome P450